MEIKDRIGCYVVDIIERFCDNRKIDKDPNFITNTLNKVAEEQRKKDAKKAWKLVCDAYAKGYNREPMIDIDEFDKYMEEEQ